MLRESSSNRTVRRLFTLLAFASIYASSGCEMLPIPGFTVAKMGSVNVRNATTDAICKVAIVSAVDSHAKVDHRDFEGPLIVPGREVNLSYVKPKTEGETPPSSQYKLAAFACTGHKGDAGHLLAEMDVDMASGHLTIGNVSIR